MCDQRHNKHTGDEDEEDLEFLRLAALKSLQNKKEPITLQYNSVSNNFQAHNESAIGQNTLYSSNRIEQQYIPTQHQISHNNYSNHNENFFPKNQRPTTYLHSIDGNNTIRTVSQNNLENYGANHDAQKINEPYVPRSLPAGAGHSNVHSSVPVFNTWITDGTIGNTHHMRHGYHPPASYGNPMPSKGIHDSISGGTLSNVQLSPRSLAFVEQNNDILARRKGGNLSPNNYNRSPRRSKSPDYRRIESSNYKIQKSPNYSPDTPTYRPSSPNYSPDFYKSTSPRRWSLSPHNYKKAMSRSPQSQSNQLLRQRSPGYIRKRTISRSPQRSSSRSPPIPTKQRTKSRSPTITITSNIKNRSPPILSSSVRRFSRSPQGKNERHGRRLSRSPKGNNSRHCSPYTSRYKNNKSPTHDPKRSPNGDSVNDLRQNRQRSPIQSSSNNLHLQYHNKNVSKRKSSSSPSNQHQQMQRKRSATPKHSSPLRKYPRMSRDGNFGGRNNDHEKNHSKRSPVNKKRRDTNGVSRNRDNFVRYNTRKSQSPNPGQTNFYKNRKRRSRSRYSEKTKRYDAKDNCDRKKNDRNGTNYKMKDHNLGKYEKQHQHINKNNNENDKNSKNENKSITKDDNNILNVEITETNDISCNDVTSLTPPLRSNEEKFNILEKTNQHKNIDIDEKSNDHYEICNNNDGDIKNNTSENDDDDDDEDGIDLFPSDDSESETEGRFKSTSNRNERKTNVPTLSFTGLNSSSVPEIVKDLQDVCSNKNSKGAAAGDHRFDRRRYDRSKKGDNSRYFRNEKRRYNDIRCRKNSRSRSIERKNKDEIGGKSERRDIEIDNKRKSMFKSTFQAIDNEGNKINIKNSSKTEKGSSLGKSNNNENSKKRFKDSEDYLENYNPQQQLKTHFLKGSLKASTPPIDNLYKYKSGKGDSIDNNINNTRSSTPNIISNEDRSNITTTNGKKSIHSRLGAMTNTFKSAKKSSLWSKNSATGSSSTPPLPSFTDKV